MIPPFKEFNDQMKGGMPSKRRLDIVQEFFKYRRTRPGSSSTSWTGTRTAWSPWRT